MIQTGQGIHFMYRKTHPRNRSVIRARNAANRLARANWARECRDSLGRKDVPFPTPIGMQEGYKQTL